MEPLIPLFERTPPAADSLPPPLAELYGGGLTLRPDLVYANFVTSLDGTVTLGNMRGAPGTISGRSDADRFVMGLLRAHADCLLIGAETLRQGPSSPWTPAQIHPPAAPLYAALGRPDPVLAVVTDSGRLGNGASALGRDGLVLTSERGARELRGSAVRTLVIGERGPLDGGAIRAALRSQGWRRVLVEAGPHLTTELVAKSVLEELFLTVSPLLAGRCKGDDRFGWLEGMHLLPERMIGSSLLDVRAHGSHLFLRYELGEE